MNYNNCLHPLVGQQPVESIYCVDVTYGRLDDVIYVKGQYQFTRLLSVLVVVPF